MTALARIRRIEEAICTISVVLEVERMKAGRSNAPPEEFMRRINLKHVALDKLLDIAAQIVEEGKSNPG